MRMCKIDGCGRKHYAKDYCRRHYKWFVEYGHTEAQNTTCEICGTELTGKKVGRRFCSHACRMRWHRQSGCYTEASTKARRGVCSIDGCGSAVHAGGVCKTHSMRKWRHGDPLAPIRTAVPCTVTGCDQSGGYGGLCPKHYMQAYVDAHRQEIYSNNNARRSRVKQATPPWLTDEDWSKIQAIYRRCAEITVATGVEHHVDHKIPIKGRGVRGLHVPWNLRVLPARDNRVKSNRI